MKKVNLFLCVLCALYAIAGNCIAQQKITDTREYGSWIYHHPTDNGDDHFNPQHKFPISGIKDGGKVIMPLNATRQKWVNDLMDVFKALYPKPHLESMFFQFVSNKPDNIKATPYLSFYSEPKPERFWYDKEGKVKKFNPGSQVGGIYGGGCTIYVNRDTDEKFLRGEPTSFDLFDVSDNLSYKTIYTSQNYGGDKENKTPRKYGKIYIAPAKNNFQEAGNFQKIKNIPNAELLNATPTMQYWRHWNPSYPKNGAYTGSLFSIVLMSYNGKMPYVNLTRGEYLDLMEEEIADIIATQPAKDKKEVEEGIKSRKDYLQVANYTYYFKRDSTERIKKHKLIADQFKKLRQQYANSLNATLYFNRPKEKNVHSENHWYYTSLGKFNIVNFETPFSDIENGMSLLKQNPNFYKGMKPDEIRFIAVSWTDATFLADEGRDKEATVNVNESWDNPNQLYTDEKRKGKKIAEYAINRALSYKMDWKKLEALLTK